MKRWIPVALLLAVTASATADEDTELAARLRASRSADSTTLSMAEDRLSSARAAVSDSDSLLLLLPLANVGRVHEILGNWGPAIEHYDTARALAERQLPPDDPRLALPLRDLANVLRIVNATQPAEEFFGRAIALQEEHLGAGAELAESLRQRVRLWLNLGRLEEAEADADRALTMDRNAATLQARARVHDTKGEFAEALVVYEEALTAARTEYGPDHVGLGDVLNDFSRHLQLRGDLERARAMLEEALAIMLQHFDEQHIYVVVIRGNLAELLSKEGDYAAAIRLIREQLDATIAAFGDEHPRVAGVMNNLAGNQLLADEPEEALALYEQSLDIYRAAYGDDHEMVGRGLSNVAGVLEELALYDEAERRLRESLAILGSNPGEDSFYFVHAELSLGEQYLASGKLEEASQVLPDAVADVERVLGRDNAFTLEGLSSLGDLALAQDRPEDAREHWLTAFERSGDRHPLRAEIAARLARLELGSDPLNAFEFALLAEDIGREHLRLLSRGASQVDALRYARSRTRGLDLAVDAAIRIDEDAITTRLFDALIRSRAIVFDEMAERALTARSSDDSELAAAREDLRAARVRLAQLLSDPSNRLDEAERDALVADAFAARDRAEERLAATSDDYRRRRISQQVGGPEVRARLDPADRLVSYLRFETAAEPRYAALVSDASSTEIVSLGDAQSIDDAVEQWRRAVRDGALPPGPLSIAAVQRYRDEMGALRERLWDPLGVSDSVSRVFIVPDGSLHHLNLAALPAAGGGYLLQEAPLLQHLSAERDLVEEFASSGRGLLAVGDVRFGERADIEGDGRCQELRGLSFSPLPSTRAEVEALGRLWTRDEATLLERDDANEDAVLRAAADKAVLHFATHGFFLGEECGLPQSPLLRSGLALAHANERDSELEHDGILTGEEILSMNLDGVERVVLSACDTGLGDLVEGAGLLGLRRAFRWSGAQSLITSLWSVDDEATRELMVAFYEADDAASTAEALRAAQLRLLDERRQQGFSEHPYYWGSFVAAGSAR